MARKQMAELVERVRLAPGKKVKLADHDPADKLGIKDKDAAQEALAENVEQIALLQERLMAERKRALLVVLQGLDASGKEGTTRADLASFESCHINFWHFEAGVGIFDWNAFSKGCGPVAFSGDLKPGSVIHAKLKGQAEGYPNKDGSKNVYKWDADVTATVRAKP